MNSKDPIGLKSNKRKKELAKKEENKFKKRKVSKAEKERINNFMLLHFLSCHRWR